MHRLVLLIGSFMLTFGLLASVWMVGSDGFARTNAVQPTPSHSPYYTLAAIAPERTLSPVPTQLPSSSATAVARSTPTREPSATKAASLDPIGSAAPAPMPLTSHVPLRTAVAVRPQPSVSYGETQTYLVAGTAYVSSDVPDGGTIVPSRNGVVISTTGDSTDALSITYAIDAADLPQSGVIEHVDTNVCGQGEGQLWEVYGPVGSTPSEQDAVAPDADGCWHFSGAATDELSVIAATMGASTLYIDRVEFVVTFGE